MGRGRRKEEGILLQRIAYFFTQNRRNELESAFPASIAIMVCELMDEENLMCTF